MNYNIILFVIVACLASFSLGYSEAKEELRDRALLLEERELEVRRGFDSKFEEMWEKRDNHLLYRCIKTFDLISIK